MRLDLDTAIRFSTGERAGFLRKVVLNEDQSVSHVVMATDDIISREVLVPIEALYEQEGAGLYIDGDSDFVGSLPDYEEESVIVAPEGWEIDVQPQAIGEVFPVSTYQPVMPITEVPAVDESSMPITQGTEVRCQDGRWGIVDEVIVDETGAVRAFVGRPDSIEEHDAAIPLELVQEANAQMVILNCTLADLPNYTQRLVDEPEEPEHT